MSGKNRFLPAETQLCVTLIMCFTWQHSLLASFTSFSVVCTCRHCCISTYCLRRRLARSR